MREKVFPITEVEEVRQFAQEKITKFETADI